MQYTQKRILDAIWYTLVIKDIAYTLREVTFSRRKETLSFWKSNKAPRTSCPTKPHQEGNFFKKKLY